MRLSLATSKAKEIILQDKQLRNEIKANKYKLKFGRPFVGVSDIAEQYFCEKSVELRYRYGEVKTRIMELGTKGHKDITLLTLPTSHEDAVKASWRKRKEPYCIANFAVGAIFKAVAILGRPDEVWFRQGDVHLVVENKFSQRLYPYNQYRVQVQLYCLLLENMGYNTKSTQYEIRIFTPQCEGCLRLELGTCPIFDSHYRHKEYKCTKGGKVKIFSYGYDKTDITNDLYWALNFWREKRQAVPTRKPEKCKNCRYKNYCRVPPLVRRRAPGR